MKGQKIFLLAAWLAFFTMANAQQYSRVVSLAPSLTKNIYYLNAQSGLVARTSYCHKAKEDDKTVVASMVTVNVERIVGLKPDLVLATSITNPEYIEMLRKFNIRVEVFPTPNSFAGVCSQFVEMGKLLGKEQDAVQQVANIKKEIDRKSVV